MAVAVEREHLRVVLSTGAKDAGSWSLVYPSQGGPARLPRPDPDLAREVHRGDVGRRPARDAGVLVGYAGCSTDKQDVAAQRHTLRVVGVSDDCVYLDHGMIGRHRRRPGLQQALAAVRQGDTLVVPKLDRLGCSVPDGRAIGDSLAAGGVRFSIGGAVYDPTDPIGKMFINILTRFAEFEVDLLRMRTREGMVGRANGKLKGSRPN